MHDDSCAVRAWFLRMVAMKRLHGSMALLMGFLSAVAAPAQWPEPPEQNRPWVAPTNGIPAKLTAAAEALFKLGFPDPRGCEYREIDVTASSVWQGIPQRVETRGWILPTQGTDKPVHAICWNGLVYPVDRLGPPGDLRGDAECAVRPRPDSMALGEALSLAPSNATTAEVLLLLRAGHSAAALRRWRAAEQMSYRGGGSSGQGDAADPFLKLATDWAWDQFERVLSAHMRGDVNIALKAARQLAAVEGGIESEAKLRGFARPSKEQLQSRSREQNLPPPYVTFLGQLPALLADIERRAQHPKKSTILDKGIESLPTGPDRIAALVADLDMIQERQQSQPGGVVLRMDPIIRALINEGEPAVEPLLVVLESDKRLTRSVGFWRDFKRDRRVITVAGAAKVALEQILQWEFYAAEEIRPYWNKLKHLKPEDRWFAVLRDDQLGAEAWLKAARNIVEPSEPNVIRFGRGVPSLPDPEAQARARGEELRSRTAPSVAEVLKQRAEIMATRAAQTDQSMAVDDIKAGVHFAALLAQWDSAASAVPTAGTLMSRSIELFADPNSFIMSSGSDLSKYIPFLTLLRVRGGDTNALGQYATWLKSLDLSKTETFGILETFRPLWEYPRHPALVQASEWLFGDPASPWAELPWKQASSDDPVASGLIDVPAFRKLVAKSLDDRRIVGSVEWQAGNYVRYQKKDSSRSFPRPDNMPVREVGTKMTLRSCDWTMLTLWQAKRVPRFDPFAPDADRDRLVQSAKKWLLGQEF